MYLHYTSLLFTTVVAHAYYASQSDVHTLFLAVSNLSILYHSLKDNDKYNKTAAFYWTMILDVVFARVTYLYMSYTLLVKSQSPFAIFIPILFVLWVLVMQAPRLGLPVDLLHGIFHFTAALAVHLHLLLQHSASGYFAGTPQKS